MKKGLILLVVLLVLAGCNLDQEEEPPVAYGILRVNFGYMGDADSIWTLHYSIDGGPEYSLSEGQTREHLLVVGNYSLSGSKTIYVPGGWMNPIFFDVEVYVWDAKYGPTDWSI